ncbi:MAG: DUF4350 domain-containing protein [Armatimonadota bacterium]
MRKRYELLALILIVGLIAGMLALGQHDDINTATTEQHTAVRSSYRTFPEGYKALYLTLRDLGYPVQRLTHEYLMLPPRGLLIVADPHFRTPLKPQQRELLISKLESRHLLEWLRGGNTALMLVEYHPGYLFNLAEKETAADPFEKFLKIPVSVVDDWWSKNEWWKRVSIDSGPTIARQPARPLVPSFLSAQAPTLDIKSIFRFPNDTPLPDEVAQVVGGAVPLYTDSRGVAVAYSRVGKGGIVWCCSPWSFSNTGIGQGKNLDFMLALADLQPGAPVIFDEFHQGYGASTTLWAVTPPMLRLGIAQLSLAILLLVVTLAWRFGIPRLPAEERFSRSRAEYLTSMASLLERANATHVVRERAGVLLRRELGRRMGLPPHAQFERFLAVNAAHPVVDQPSLERVVRQLMNIEQVKRPDPQALWRLLGDIHRLLHRK